MKHYDLAVVGGGFAGVAAALAAARGGAKVILIEKSNCLGGAASNCLVLPFMSYHTEMDGRRVDLSAGIFAEIHRKLTERGGMRHEDFAEEVLKALLNDMMLEAGVELLFHAYLTEAERMDRRIRTATFATKCGKLHVEADYFIDATGDAQLAYLASCPTRLGREPDHLCQPMTLCFRVGNVNTERFYESRPRFQQIWAEHLTAGKLSNPRENILVFRTPVPNVLHFNTTRIIKLNPTDPFDVTKAEIEARRQVFEVFDFLKKHADGMENSYISMTAAEIGVRESRMIVGDHVLTEQECRAFTKFEDGIAACNYDIDIHNPEGSGTSHYYFPKGQYYTIPYRSLIPMGVDNLLGAGRCISCDHGAQASLRIMPTVCTLGEAAGTAIAIALQSNATVKEVDVALLQATLQANGAFLGL